VVVLTVPVSLGAREFRSRQWITLHAATSEKEKPGYLWMSKDALVTNMRRSELMGKAKSVHGELDAIQQWHREHHYTGGLVLRDLKLPLFAEENMEDIVEDPMRRARRECYYLYYERKPNAEMQQEIFCRGTTLLVDILTCLQTWYVYDEELDVKLHAGFRNHANRLLDDLIPLLVKDKRATVAISGHSLGGAVASILALKLQKRGYNVIQLTTTAAPRFCNQEAAAKLSPLLPKQTLRVADDRDIVPLLPPFASHLNCDKLWLSKNDQPRFVPKTNAPWWVDSVFINFLFWEILSSFGHRHLVGSHVAEVEKIK